MKDLPSLKKPSFAIAAIFSILAGFSLNSAQLKTAEQAAIQAEILNSPSIVVAAKTEQKDDEAPDRGKARPRLVDPQKEDTETELNQIIASVRVRVKGEPTPSNDSKRRSYEISKEIV